MKVTLRSDGAYAIDHATGGFVSAVAIINADGSLTIHVPARDVVIESLLDPERAFDFSDVEVSALAVRKGLVEVATVRAVRPATADEIERRGVR